VSVSQIWPPADRQQDQVLLAAILESATDYAIITTDLGGVVTSWNSGAQNLMGWSAAEMIDRPAALIFTPEDRTLGCPEAERHDALERGHAKDERWHIRKDGTRFWGHGELMPLRVRGGPVQGYLKILRDRTEERRHTTDVGRAAQALQQSNERLRIAQRAGSIGTFELLPSSGKILPSEEFCRLWGMPVREEYDVATFLALIHPEDSARVTTGRSVLPQGALEYVEYRITRPDTGELRWMARRGEFIEDPATGAQRYLGVSYDITERKRVEEALREETHALEILNRTGSAVSAELDLDRLVQIVTDAGVELTGAAFGAFFYNKVDAAGERYTLYTIAGVAREEFSKFPMPRKTHVFAPTFDGSDIVRSEDITTDPRYGRNDPHFGMPAGHLPVRSYLAVPVKSRTGEVLGGLFFGHPERGVFTERSEGVITGIAGQAATAIDNARLFEARNQLNESLERQVAERTADRDRMWRLATDLMLVARFDATITAVNPAWTRTLGWRADELIGTAFLDLAHPDDVAQTAAEASRLAEGVTTERFENRYRHKDGSYRWLSWIAVPEAGLIHAVARDVTGEKEAAAALRDAEEQLRQAQKMEAVGQLTGGIAHDFNNLLTGIVGSLDLLQTRVAQGRTESIERYVKAAMNSAQRAAALTHRLLAFSRRQPLDPKPVNANKLIASMEDLLRRTIGPSVALEMVTAGGLWTTLCDPNQLENAILNLAINARDAMPEGGKLVIETANARLDDAYAAKQRDVTPGQYVAICVTDTGTGMPREVIARAFDPFFTTKPLGQGTGLGLSMVYGFAKQSNGHVRIYSEEGQGTTVKIYLPRHWGGAEDGEDVSGLAAMPRTEAGGTVLVVEDEPVVRDLIVEVLQELGYEPLQATDGPSGLKVLQSSRRIDLLVTDVGLPGGINGRQLADQARERRPDLKVLFITGYAENAAIAAGFLEPGMEMITKPFSVEALATKIRHMTRSTEHP